MVPHGVEARQAECRLAAIRADVLGSLRPMSVDGGGTLRRLKAHYRAAITADKPVGLDTGHDWAPYRLRDLFGVDLRIRAIPRISSESQQ